MKLKKRIFKRVHRLTKRQFRDALWNCSRVAVWIGQSKRWAEVARQFPSQLDVVFRCQDRHRNAMSTANSYRDEAMGCAGL